MSVCVAPSKLWVVPPAVTLKRFDGWRTSTALFLSSSAHVLDVYLFTCTYMDVCVCWYMHGLCIFGVRKLRMCVCITYLLVYGF